MFPRGRLSPGLERFIELARQGLIGQKNWDIQEHYSMVPSFFLEPDYAARIDGVWLEVSGGNIVVPNFLRLKLNGHILDLWPEGPFTKTKSWRLENAWDYRFRLRVPASFLRAGKNAIWVTTHMLPGLERELGVSSSEKEHNISVAGITVELILKGAK